MRKVIYFLMVGVLIFSSAVLAKEKFFAGVKTDKKIIFLTFDDGPGPWTEQVLELLRKYNIKATFFVLGELAEYRKELVKKIFSSGHTIGSHSYRHINFYKIQKNNSLEETKKIFVDELVKSISVIEDIIGEKPKYLRMPHGFYKKWMDEFLSKYGLVVINWSFGCDWEKFPEQKMVEEYCSHLKPGGIYLFHDGGKDRSKTLKVVERFVQYAIKEGYTFETFQNFIER